MIRYYRDDMIADAMAEILKYFFRELFKLLFPRKDTVKIAILGCKGCGKTELWCRLQGKDNLSHGGTSQEKIDSFIIGKKSDGTKVEVAATKDIGGGDSWVSEYESLINHDGTFIYFLIDLTKMEEKNVDDIRDRLRKISAIMENGKFKNCGLRILATFFDKYNGTEAQAISYIKEKVFKKRIKGIDMEKRIQVINVTDNNHVEIIREQILKSIEE